MSANNDEWNGACFIAAIIQIVTWHFGEDMSAGPLGYGELCLQKKEFWKV